MSDHDNQSPRHLAGGDTQEPELDRELREKLPLENEPEPDPDPSGHPHRNPDRLAHDDPETEEDTASGGPA